VVIRAPAGTVATPPPARHRKIEPQTRRSTPQRHASNIRPSVSPGTATSSAPKRPGHRDG
jgi:hypothetical protein